MRDYVLTLLVAAAVTYMLTPLVRAGAARVGALKQPRDRDVHVVPVATLGGIAMFGGLAAGLLVADQIPRLRQGLAGTGMMTGLLLAGGLLVAIGIIDDRWGMGALAKAAGQVAAGGILVATGTTLTWLPLPGGRTFVPTNDQSTALTILIVVATVNAVNFIDGLDGLAAGIVCIAAVSFFLYYYSLTKVVQLDALAAPALASAILIGMCIGFLPHNFSPAKIFMGDTGSMLLGLLLAYAAISSIASLPPANLTSEINRYPVILPLLLPAALLVIPYADLLLAVVRRTRAGLSPFAPDRKHLHHRLLDIGHSQRASVLIMYLWAALFSGSVVWLSLEKTQETGAANHHGHPIVVFVLVTIGALVVLLLMSLPRLRWWQRQPRAALADQMAAVPSAGVPAASAVAEREVAPALVGQPAASSATAVRPGGRYQASASVLRQPEPVRPPETAGPPERVRPPEDGRQSEDKRQSGDGLAPPRGIDEVGQAGSQRTQSAGSAWPEPSRLASRPAGLPRSVIGTVPPAVTGPIRTAQGPSQEPGAGFGSLPGDQA